MITAITMITMIMMLTMITMITILTMITARQLRRARRKLRQLTLTGYFHRHRHHCNIICHHCRPFPECTDTDGSLTQEWGQTAGRLQRIQEVAATPLGISPPNKHIYKKTASEMHVAPRIVVHCCYSLRIS